MKNKSLHSIFYKSIAIVFLMNTKKSKVSSKSKKSECNMMILAFVGFLVFVMMNKKNVVEGFSKNSTTNRHKICVSDDNTDELFGAIVKSPMQLLNEMITFFDVSLPNPETSAEDFYHTFFKKFIYSSYLAGAGMSFFSPPSVAGYPAHYQEPDFDRHWFSSTTIVSRYKLIESLIAGRNKISTNALIMTQIDTVGFVDNNIENPSSISDLVSELASLLYPEEIESNRRDYFIQIALDGYEEYYWSLAWSNYITNGDDIIVRNRLNALITVMVNASEFQLM